MNDKQKKFCQEYIVDLNITQSAIRAGYSEKTARQIGSKLLTKVDIQDYIQELMDKRSKKVEITAEDVLNDILDTRDILKKEMEHSEDLKPSDIATLSNARKSNNELLGKHLKLFTDKVEVSVKEMPEIKLGK